MNQIASTASFPALFSTSRLRGESRMSDRSARNAPPLNLKSLGAQPPAGGASATVGGGAVNAPPPVLGIGESAQADAPAALAKSGTAYGLPLAELRILGAARGLGVTTNAAGGTSATPSAPTSGASRNAALPTSVADAVSREGDDNNDRDAASAVDDARGETATATADGDADDAEGVAGGARGTDGQPLSESEVRQVQVLKQRDTEVRQHEQAHIAGSGGNARGGARFSYQTGPDGRRYAVGGEVSVDTSAAANPEATIRKMQAVRRGALAPANPSAQDRSVAAAASRQAAAARAEIIELRTEENQPAEKPDESEKAIADSAPNDAAQERTAVASDSAGTAAAGRGGVRAGVISPAGTGINPRADTSEADLTNALIPTRQALARAAYNAA